MPRDRIAELLLIKQRAGKYKRIPSKSDLETLKRVWDGQLKGVDPIDELIPIRVVTILEVFVRHWTGILIDHGAPYVERASKLKVDLKYDFAIARSLEGGSVSLGDLLAHSVSLNRVETISAVLSTLLGQDIFNAIATTRDRWRVKSEGEAVGPIIRDISWVRKKLARLFEVRHVLVHELPENKPHQLDEVSEFIYAASLFVEASEEEFATRIYGEYALTQREMNIDAAAHYDAAMIELEEICKKIEAEEGEIDSYEIRKVQIVWQKFKEDEAERQAERHLGGTIRPMLYSLAAEGITRRRVSELKDWLDSRM